MNGRVWSRELRRRTTGREHPKLLPPWPAFTGAPCFAHVPHPRRRATAAAGNGGATVIVVSGGTTAPGGGGGSRAGLRAD
jgi:hypothetical protein